VNGSSETDEIKHEIERTRSEMSETLGEIQDRLRPDHLLQQARDGVTQAAKGKVRNIMSSAGDTAGMVAARAKGAGNYLSDYALEHPIRIAVTIGALTWWMLRGRDRSFDWDGAADTNWDDEEAMGYDEGRSLRDRAGEVVSTARETVGEYAASARDTVGAYASGAREKAGEYASTARDKAGEYASSARQVAGEYASTAANRARSAANTTGDWVTENPMAAGAIALAIGAAIGMTAPRTELEDSTLGETRDRAWQKASQVAQNLKENVTEKVSAAAENLVGETLKNASTTLPGEGRTL
jgi:ElaB/YqjD/DUF883 family membrane-anchored ribosome-binding protein